MSQPILSICIPTYNRARCLAQRLTELERLLGGIEGESIEVFVSDNGSPDETRQVMESFQGKFRNYRYHSSPMNYGADYNFLNCMTRASGEYLWLFSDDDFFLDNSVRDALALASSREFSCIVANQSFGDTYSCREAYGPKMFDLSVPRVGVLSDLAREYGILNLFGLVSAIIFRRPPLQIPDWIRHQNYESALVHVTVVYEAFHRDFAQITAQPLLFVEPPIEHQVREHQLQQDPRINHRMWSLNITSFFVDMMKRGVLTGDEAQTMFYDIRHCKMPLADHIVSSFKSGISEIREIPPASWEKLLRFLQFLGDEANLQLTERMRAFHDQLLGDITSARQNGEIRAGISHRLEMLQSG